MYSIIRDKYQELELPFKFPDMILPDCCNLQSQPQTPSRPKSTVPRSNRISTFRVDTPNPAIDYSHSIEDFLDSVPLEPTKYEYKKLKERDQRKHVIKIKADAYKRKENLKFNRYINIHPYDFNRIKLESSSTGCDYVNGTHITGIKSEKSSSESTPIIDRSRSNDYSKYDNINFLASQGPLPETLEHHWQAMYENDVDIIVMLTKLTEGEINGNPGTIKCEQYWPIDVGETMTYGNYDICLVTEDRLRPVTVKRQLYLLDTRAECDKRQTGKEKTLVQLHYVGWPDYGVPEENDHIVNLVKDVREIIKDDTSRQKKCNILVHCSAGVGRTGTFIALYNLMEQIENIMKDRVDNQITGTENRNQQLNIFSTVYELRSKRVEMVQSWAQYKYLYASVSAYASMLNGSDTESDYVDYVI